MKTLQSADDKMTFCHLLKVINEQRVDYRPAKGSDNRHCLGCHLFRHNDGEARGNLGDEPNDCRGPLIGKAFFAKWAAASEMALAIAARVVK